MNKLNQKELKLFAYNARAHIIKMAGRGGCFIGSSLSCVDLIVYLYNNFLNIDYLNQNQQRDYFFLSKGHAVPALYSVLIEKEIISKKTIENHLKLKDNIYWHPNRNVKGVEFHFGSLGHGLSIGVGVALDCKLRKSDNNIVVMMGDGELNEGSVWESVLVASALKLDNLILIIDRNMLQANMLTEELIPLESIEKKFRAFNWNTAYINGHDFSQMEHAFDYLPRGNKKPNLIIADTIRGKGIPAIEMKVDKWFVNLSDDDTKLYLNELKVNCLELIK